jgi:hypothetical protein
VAAAARFLLDVAEQVLPMRYIGQFLFYFCEDKHEGPSDFFLTLCTELQIRN